MPDAIFCFRICFSSAEIITSAGELVEVCASAVLHLCLCSTISPPALYFCFMLLFLLLLCAVTWILFLPSQTAWQLNLCFKSGRITHTTHDTHAVSELSSMWSPSPKTRRTWCHFNVSCFCPCLSACFIWQWLFYLTWSFDCLLVFSVPHWCRGRLLFAWLCTNLTSHHGGCYWVDWA